MTDLNDLSVWRGLAVRAWRRQAVAPGGYGGGIEPDEAAVLARLPWDRWDFSDVQGGGAGQETVGGIQARLRGAAASFVQPSGPPWVPVATPSFRRTRRRTIYHLGATHDQLHAVGPIAVGGMLGRQYVQNNDARAVGHRACYYAGMPPVLYNNGTLDTPEPKHVVAVPRGVRVGRRGVGPVPRQPGRGRHARQRAGVG